MADAPTQDRPLFYVEVGGKELDGRQFEVGPDGLLVGRSPTCDVMFEDLEVSRRHAYFYPADQWCYVKDLGSKNGVLVNGRLIKERRLADGDVVDIGPGRFVLRVEGGAPDRVVGPAPDEETEGAVAFEVSERQAAALMAGRHPLAVLGLVFGVLACLQWVFGLGAVLLALLALWEMRRDPQRTGTALALGGLLLGIVGGALNGWFAEAAPRLREQQERAARFECKENLSRIAAALDSYRRSHDGAYPARLEDLAAEGLLEERLLECPGCRLDRREERQYLFLGEDAETWTASLDVVVCDAGVACHQGRGGWVLRRDGRVEWAPRGRFVRLLDRLQSGGRSPPQRAGGSAGGRR